jgi:hypothetical protein
VHRPLLGNPVGALGEDVEFAVLGQQLYLHARPGVLPRPAGSSGFSIPLGIQPPRQQAKESDVGNR